MNYIFIKQLFTNILKTSQSIQGRFHICPLMAAELNTSTLGDIVTKAIPEDSKYPCALMMPPVSSGDYYDRSAKWDNLDIMLFFLNSTGYNNGQITNMDPDTVTSQDGPVEEWQAMKTVAADFLTVLKELTVTQDPMAQSVIYRVSDKVDPTITPISNVANDKVSGVMVRFRVATSMLCDVSDYSNDYSQTIQIPL